MARKLEPFIGDLDKAPVDGTHVGHNTIREGAVGGLEGGGEGFGGGGQGEDKVFLGGARVGGGRGGGA